MTRILCVEDEPDLREDLLEIIEEEGFETAYATNGAEGLALLESFQPDLIISDCLMPVMNGVEMLQRIRSEHPAHAKTPVIFLSAHAGREEVDRGIDVGANSYITKPVNFERLLQVIRSLVKSVETPRAAPVDVPSNHSISLEKAK